MKHTVVSNWRWLSPHFQEMRVRAFLFCGLVTHLARPQAALSPHSFPPVLFCHYGEDCSSQLTRSVHLGGPYKAGQEQTPAGHWLFPPLPAALGCRHTPSNFLLSVHLKCVDRGSRCIPQAHSSVSNVLSQQWGWVDGWTR